MKSRLKKAVEEGVVLGVKFGIALALVLLFSGWVVRDYLIIRARAYNGQLAFEYLVKQEQDAKK